MVRMQTLPFQDYAFATAGQLSWVALNQLIDYDERIRKIHIHCLPKFKQETCEVCGEKVFDVSKLPPEIQEQVYRPGEDDDFNKVIEFPDQRGFGEGNGAVDAGVIDVEMDE